MAAGSSIRPQVTASVVFARKPNGSWRICFEYRGLNAITEPLAKALPLRGGCWFTEFELVQRCHPVLPQEADSDWWMTSVRSQTGQFECKVVPLGLQGHLWSSERLGHDHDAGPSRLHPATPEPGPDGPAPGPPASGVQGASGPLHLSVVVYMDDLLCYSPSLEQHLRNVREVLAILWQERLCLKASMCAYGREELRFLGHSVSSAGVAVDPRVAAQLRT